MNSLSTCRCAANQDVVTPQMTSLIRHHRATPTISCALPVHSSYGSPPVKHRQRCLRLWPGSCNTCIYRMPSPSSSPVRRSRCMYEEKRANPFRSHRRLFLGARLSSTIQYRLTDTGCVVFVPVTGSSVPSSYSKDHFGPHFVRISRVGVSLLVISCVRTRLSSYQCGIASIDRKSVV